MATYNFTIPQGASLSLPITLKDADDNVINLTGYSVAMQIRKQKTAKDAVDTLTTANSRITLAPVQGKFTLVFPHSVTEDFPSGRLVYDVEITSGDDERTRILEGVITVTPEVTRV